MDFDPFRNSPYPQAQTNDGPLSSSSSSSLGQSRSQSANISLHDVNFDLDDSDHWLQYNTYTPYDYPQTFSPMDPMGSFSSAPFQSMDLSSARNVLGPPFTLAPPTESSFNPHVGSDYPTTFIRQQPAINRGHSSIPTIRVITDVPSTIPQFSTSNVGISPYSETSSGSSFPSHPSTPLFPQLPYYNPSPISDIASPNTPDYSGNPHRYIPQPTLSIWDIAAGFPPAGRGPAIPQKSYRPHTLSDRKRYVEEVELEEPITFIMKDPDECGIPLSDALTGKYMRLKGRDDAMFVQRGPSVSIRLKWPGYGNWSRQIPTKDFRSPPGPITRAKLAKNIARTVERFIKEKQNKQHSDPEDEQWRVGPGHIGVNDLILVGLQHVSKGSWQAHLRLARPFPAS